MVSSCLKKRLISGFILGPITLVAIITGGIYFKAFVAIAFGLSFKEWVRMALKSKTALRDSIIGVLYLLIGFMAFMTLRLELPQGMYLTFVLMIGVWGSDIAAYFAGKKFGGAKLAETISPNKTWAGLFGGMVGSAFVLILFNVLAEPLGNIVGYELSAFMSFPKAIVVGVFFTVLGQGGDLLMSFYKRRVGVKDTGTLIPGHGGLLDRIDSLLIVSPFFLVVLSL